DGDQNRTFTEAARFKGLLEDNTIWEKTLTQACHSLNPRQMRQLFANILAFGSTEKCIIDALHLWEMFSEHIYDKRSNNTEAILRKDRALAIIEKLLIAQGRLLTEFGLPLPQNSLSNDPDRAVDEFFFPSTLNSDEIDDTVDLSVIEKAKLN